MYPASLRKISTRTVDSSQYFERWIFQKATKDNQQSHKILGRKRIWRSGTGLYRIGPPISSLIVVVKVKFTEISTNLFNSHLSCTLSCSMMNLEKKVESFWKIYVHRYWQSNSQYKVYNFQWCIIQLLNNFALRYAQWSVVLCLNG